MNRFLLLVGFMLVAAFGQGCSTMHDSPAEMAAAARQLDHRFTEAFSKGDLDGLMANYWNSPDLVVYPPGEMQAKGWEAVRASLDISLKSMPGRKLELTEPHYLVVGDAVINYGLWKISFPGSNPPIPDLPGRYSAVAMKKDGHWVLVVDHISVPMTER